MESCRECCFAAPTGANLYCSMNDCYVGELSCDDFEPTAKHMTNADRIRAMTDEELADHFSLWCCRSTTDDSYCKSFGTCDKCWLDWLKQEASDGKD